jgi:cytochrome c peroxidase
MKNYVAISLLGILLLTSCTNNSEEDYEDVTSYPFVEAEFGSSVNLDNLDNYANQSVPAYITKNNSQGNLITNAGATLGRVLFYDKKLSSNNTISCSSCHIQSKAFGDGSIASQGVNGRTGRHSMRLINVRFANERKFFWDERAINLETQTTMPIKDHGEMGFSGQNGDLSFANLIVKLTAVGYYKELFKFVYGSEEITEVKIQNALSQFIRSIQSFDSKYDAGRVLAPNEAQPFANFTAEENLGKNLFLTPPVFDTNGFRTGGGIGCNACHNAPEFDINPNSLSNGIGGSINGGPDFTNTRAPSLRNIANPLGEPNGPMMHTGAITSLQAAIGHYGDLSNAAANNPNLDPRLKPNGRGQQLNLRSNEVDAVIAFLKTLSGSDVYTNTKWSTPFR